MNWNLPGRVVRVPLVGGGGPAELVEGKGLVDGARDLFERHRSPVGAADPRGNPQRPGPR